MSPWLLFHKFNNSKYYSHTINYCLLYYITYTIMMVFCLFFLYEKVCFHAIRYFFSDLITNICITMFTCLLWTVYIIAFCRWWIWLQLLLPWWSSLVLTIHFNIWSLILPKDFAFLWYDHHKPILHVTITLSSQILKLMFLVYCMLTLFLFYLSYWHLSSLHILLGFLMSCLTFPNYYLKLVSLLSFCFVYL